MNSKKFESFTVYHFIPVALSFASIYHSVRFNSALRFFHHAQLIQEEDRSNNREELIRRKSYSFGNNPQVCAPKPHARELPASRQPRYSETKIPRLDTFKFYLIRLTIFAHLVLSIKYIILCLLDLESLSQYRYLDCFLLGRQVVAARISMYVKYLALFFNIIISFWHSLIHVKDFGFRFDCIDFVFHDYDDIFEREIDIDSESADENDTGRHGREVIPGDSYGTPPRFIIEDQKYAGEFNGCFNSTKSGIDLMDFSPILHVRNQNGSKDEPILLRPNRSSLALVWFRQISKVACVTCLVSLITTHLMNWILSFGVHTTKRGFELSYTNCVRWIMEQGEKNESLVDFERIYRFEAGHVLSVMQIENLIELKDFNPINSYHIIRMFMDILENFFFWSMMTIGLVGVVYSLVLTMADVHLYIKTIEERIDNVIGALKSHLVTTTRMELSQCDHEHGLKIDRIQILAADLFSMVCRYSRHTSFFLLLFVISWSLFIILTGNLMFTHRNILGHFRMEWYILQGFLTSLLILLNGSLGYLRWYSLRIYGKMCRLMALDRDYRRTKLRWIMVLRMYFPRPLNCFTLLGSIQITYFLSLKLMAWMFSIVLVMGSLRLGFYN